MSWPVRERGIFQMATSLWRRRGFSEGALLVALSILVILLIVQVLTSFHS